MWVKKKSRRYEKYYFYNTETCESTWERPTDGFELFHILIKHAESRNPDPSLTKKRALEMCQAIYDGLRADFNEDRFTENARTYSKCSSSARGGYLGTVVGNEMVKEFEDEAFRLEKGQMTGPVETASGYHIIYRR